MRPTNLGFKSPREISQSPYYNPPVTSQGQSLTYTTTQTKQRPKSNQGSRFRECHPQPSSSVFVGPGRYKDDYKSISNALKTKIRPKYKGDMIDTSSNSYTYVGDSKVLDLAFLSPQGRKPVHQASKKSIDMTSPKFTPVTSLDLFSSNPIITPSQPSYTKTSMNKLDISVKSKPSNHQRTLSLQTSGRNKTPAGRKTSTTVNHVFTEYTRTIFTEQDTDKSKRLTTTQKQINNNIYNKILEAQLSPELKLIKKELESFQTKKKPIKEIPKTEIRLASIQTEEDEPQKKMESIKEKIEEKENEQDEDETLGFNLEQFLDKEKTNNNSKQTKIVFDDYKVLAEASINTQSFRTPQPSVFQNFPHDTLSSNLSSPKFGVKQPEIKYKESNTMKTLRTNSSGRESGLKGKIPVPNSMYMGHASYGIQSSKSGNTGKGVRMI